MSVTNGGRVHNTPQIQPTLTPTTQTNRQNAPTVPSNIRSQTPTNTNVSGNQRSQVTITTQNNSPNKAMVWLKGAKRNIGNFFRNVGNSQFGVGTGHFFQALVGKSAFCAARNAVRQDTGGKSGAFHIEVNRNRSTAQAQWANHGSWVGSVLNPIAAVAGLCGAIYGAVEGKATPTLKSTSQIVAPKKKGGDDWDGKRKKALVMNGIKNSVRATSRRTDSLKTALKMLDDNPKNRMYCGSEQLRATDKIQMYRGIRENVFKKEWSVENLDFMFAMQFIDENPTAENLDLVFKDYIDTTGAFGVNIDFTERNLLRSITNASTRSGNEPLKMDPHVKQNLMAALDEDENGAHFQQLPDWMQNRLVDGRDYRDDGGGFRMSDIFGTNGNNGGAKSKIYMLLDDTTRRWKSTNE